MVDVYREVMSSFRAIYACWEGSGLTSKALRLRARFWPHPGTLTFTVQRNLDPKGSGGPIRAVSTDRINLKEPSLADAGAHPQL